MKIKYLIILVALGILSLPLSAMANPVQIPVASITVLPILLYAEGFIIGTFGKQSQIHRIRFANVWFIITFLTWIPFIISIRYLVPHLGAATSTVIGESVVIAIEAFIIWRMLRMPFFAAQFENSPTIMRAVYYSAAANLVSFGGSLAAFALEIYLF